MRQSFRIGHCCSLGGLVTGQQGLVDSIAASLFENNWLILRRGALVRVWPKASHTDRTILQLNHLCSKPINVQKPNIWSPAPHCVETKARYNVIHASRSLELFWNVKNMTTLMSRIFHWYIRINVSKKAPLDPETAYFTRQNTQGISFVNKLLECTCNLK